MAFATGLSFPRIECSVLSLFARSITSNLLCVSNNKTLLTLERRHTRCRLSNQTDTERMMKQEKRRLDGSSFHPSIDRNNGNTSGGLPILCTENCRTRHAPPYLIICQNFMINKVVRLRLWIWGPCRLQMSAMNPIQESLQLSINSTQPLIREVLMGTLIASFSTALRRSSSSTFL